MMEGKLMCALVFWSCLIPAAAQEKIRISEKIELSQENLPEGVSPPEVKGEFDQYVKALEQELKAQAGTFNPECQWLISVKLVVKPKSKVIELTLDPGRPASPRIMTTGFIRRPDFETDDAYKEAFKSVVKIVIARAASC
jgi:hypothetical protein